MKTNVKLLAGGLAATLLPIAAGAAFFPWTEEPSAPRAGETGDTGEAGAPTEPVPSPRLDSELAATHRASAEAVEPAPEREPEPSVEVDPHTPELAEGPLRVRRLIVATGVRDREPTGAADVFALGAQRRLYAFVDAANATADDARLRVTFEPPGAGESTGHVALDVPAGAPRWRTWAYTRHVYEPGRWHVVVRGPDGRELARRAFDVEPRR